MQDHVGQPVVERQAGVGGRRLDGGTELVGRHRLDQELVVAQCGQQLGVLGGPAVEVRPQGEHDQRPRTLLAGRSGEGGQRPQERSALRRVGDQGEQLLELVDQQHQSSVRPVGQQLVDQRDGVVGVLGQQVGRVRRRGVEVCGQAPQRARAGGEAQAGPAGRPGQAAGAEPGQQAGVQQRGLSRARRSDQDERPGPSAPSASAVSATAASTRSVIRSRQKNTAASSTPNASRPG